jgi:predicted acetyltransferase
MDQQPLDVSIADESEKSIIERLIQLYKHDFSELAKIGEPYGEIGDDGLFKYDHLDSYWTDDRRKPILFRVYAHIAGFALVNDWAASGLAVDYCMAEFFVLRKYRRIGIGKKVVQELLRQYPGTWEIAVTHYNRPAMTFWRSVIASITKHRVEELAGDGQRWSGPIWRLTPDHAS